MNPLWPELCNDARLDLVLGDSDGRLSFWTNDASLFNAQNGPANPFDGIDVSLHSTPSFVDLDGDGDLDLLSGEAYDTLKVRTNTAGVFSAQTGAASPFDGINVGIWSTPSFVDLEGEGDLDLVVGNSDGTLITYDNTTPHGVPIVVTVTAQTDTINGTADDDMLVGTAGPDVINGIGGDDAITGGIGDDTVFGGAGDNRLIAGATGGSCYGGDDSDIFSHGTGGSSAFGGAAQICSSCGRSMAPLP